jgi:hypothetical protein
LPARFPFCSFWNDDSPAGSSREKSNPPAATGGFDFSRTRGPTLPRNGDELVGDELCPLLHRLCLTFHTTNNNTYRIGRRPSCSAALIALHAGAIPHQHEVAALAVRLAFVSLGVRLGAACGGAGFAPSSRFEIPGRRELVLGLRSRQRKSRHRRVEAGGGAGRADRGDRRAHDDEIVGARACQTLGDVARPSHRVVRKHAAAAVVRTHLRGKASPCAAAGETNLGTTAAGRSEQRCGIRFLCKRLIFRCNTHTDTLSFRDRSESAQKNDLHFQGSFSASVRVHFGSIERQQPIFWLNRSLTRRFSTRTRIAKFARNVGGFGRERCLGRPPRKADVLPVDQRYYLSLR